MSRQLLAGALPVAATAALALLPGCRAAGLGLRCAAGSLTPAAMPAVSDGRSVGA